MRIAVSLRSVWARGVFVFRTAPGVLMVSTAALSTYPRMREAPYGPFEGPFPSCTPTTMRFALTFGALVRFRQRRKEHRPGVSLMLLR